MADAPAIVVVSGLPRSGTSMMMQALAAGGVPVLTDGVRAADEDNPNGYFELEAVKQLPVDSRWLAEARGKAVKIVSPLLPHLPAVHRYRVIFLRRDLDEVLASQRTMLARRGSAPTDDEAQLKQQFIRHLNDVTAWLARQPNLEVLYLNHRRIVTAPRDALVALGHFLGPAFAVEAAAAAIDPARYRSRR